jgi:hypothetical protein
MAEINYNNLYNQLKPMEQRYYDQQFSKNYVPGQENIMLSSQPAYEQMKAAYEAEQQIPESSIFDSIFGSASAAEPPTIPNLNYRNITPTFNLGTGITNTSAVKNMYTPFSTNQEMVNTDLVNQLIQENQMKANVFRRPNIMDVSGGITAAAPLQNLGIDTSYGVANEPDEEQVEYLGDKPKGGIADLLKTIIGFAVPGAGFLMNMGRDGLQGIQSLNQRLRATPFARSKNLAEYFDRRSRAKNAARMEEKYKDFSERTSGAGATGGDRDFSTPAGKSTSYEEASRAFGTGR